MEPIKLDLGSANRPPEGYIGVDKYDPGADEHWDVTEPFPYGDNTVEAIRTYHLLEHLPEYAVHPCLLECCRVLRPDGEIEIEVPDLPWILAEWVSLSDEERWGWKLQTIFGLQCHDGEFHRTGFSPNRLGWHLEQAGFKIDFVTRRWSQPLSQSVIWAKARKK